MSARPRIVKLAILALEAAGSLLLVLALYGLFIVFLHALFPSGTPLKELMSGASEQLPARDAAGRRPEATLKGLLREVRCRRGNSVAWGRAREGMLLYNDDGVQTFDRSGATIAFAPGDLLSMGSNSMVLVTRLNEKVEGVPRAYRVQVEGELRGDLSGSKGVRMELATLGHLARFVPGQARFKLTPNGDYGASLAVYRGEAHIPARDGMVRVPAYFGIKLKRGVPAGPAVPLPPAPELKGDLLLYKYRLLPPKVRFTWEGGPGEYHFQLAGDPGFRKPLLDKRVALPELAFGTLEAGRYFWRVSRIEDALEGRFSATGQCTLLQSLTPPGLRVAFPPQDALPGTFRLTGSAEPGSRIFVNGVEVPEHGGGGFSHELQVRPGVNLIRVEALDAAGNASYASRVVYGGQQAAGR